VARTGAAEPDDVVAIVDVDRNQPITSARRTVNGSVPDWRVRVLRVIQNTSCLRRVPNN
jgi:hypothetical protein